MTEARTEAAPRRSPRKVWLIAAGVFAASTSSVVQAARLGTRDEPALDSLSEPAPVAAPRKATSFESLRTTVVQKPAARASVEAPEASFELHITSVPSGAIVTESGKLVGKTPLTLVSERSDIARAPRQFIVSSPGYLPFTLIQTMSNADASVTATLSAIKPKAPAPIVPERAAPLVPAPELEIRLQR